MAALDDQIRETLNRLLDSLRSRLESEFGTYQDELVRTAQDASNRLAAEAAEQGAAAAQQEAEQRLSQVRDSAARDAEEQRSRFITDIEELQIRVDGLQRCVDEAQQNAHRLSAEKDESRRETEAARVQIEALTSELEDARTQLDLTRDNVEATLRDIEALRHESETSRGDVNRLAGELRKKDEWARQASRLPDAVRSLDEAVTYGEVLETLALLAARDAGRAAVFLVRGSRLSDCRMVGFGSSGARLDIDLSQSGPMAAAVQSGSGVARCAPSAVPEFARTDDERVPAAWPVSVGGSVVAVLYADGPAADTSDEPFWPAALDVLARHAGRVLEGITVRQAAGLMTGKSIGFGSSSGSRQSSGGMQ